MRPLAARGKVECDRQQFCRSVHVPASIRAVRTRRDQSIYEQSTRLLFLRH